MARSAEEIVKLQMGGLVLQLAQAQAQIEDLQAKLAMHEQSAMAQKAPTEGPAKQHGPR